MKKWSRDDNAEDWERDLTIGSDIDLELSSIDFSPLHSSRIQISLCSIPTLDVAGLDKLLQAPHNFSLVYLIYACWVGEGIINCNVMPKLINIADFPYNHNARWASYAPWLSPTLFPLEEESRLEEIETDTSCEVAATLKTTQDELWAYIYAVLLRR